jgi:hypothetical protein
MKFRNASAVQPGAGECLVNRWLLGYVIPAQAGSQCVDLDSRLRWNDG